MRQEGGHLLLVAGPNGKVGTGEKDTRRWYSSGNHLLLPDNPIRRIWCVVQQQGDAMVQLKGVI